MDGRLAIPSLGPNGVQALRFRCLDGHDHGEVDCPKYWGPGGYPTRLFNTRVLREAQDVIAICEGELDALVLNQAGMPAVAVTGVKNWKEHYPRIFTGFSKVLVVADNDTAGIDFAKAVNKSLLSGRIITIGQKGDDVTSFFVREGREALRKALGLEETE